MLSTLAGILRYALSAFFIFFMFQLFRMIRRERH